MPAPFPPSSTPPSESRASEPLAPPEPANGATLFGLEVERRRRLARRGRLRVGCGEVDERALGGGFERGVVVGVSAEAEEMGMVFGLQTIAHSLVFDTPSAGLRPDGRPGRPRAAIITTLAATAILPTLRDVIRAQARARLGAGSQAIDAEVRRCLELISISRVFDVEGLWEVFSELELQAKEYARDEEGDQISSSEKQAEDNDGGRVPDQEPMPEDSYPLPPESSQRPPFSSPLSSLSSMSPVPELPPLRTSAPPPPRIRTGEVLDSEEEDLLSTPSDSSPLSASSPRPPEQGLAPDSPAKSPSNPPAIAADKAPGVPQPKHPPKTRFADDPPLNVPDIILVTHFSSLLTSLFTHKDKTSAHTSLQLLSSHLRYLTRISGPLIMLLNSTNSPAVPPTTTTTSHGNNNTDSPTRPDRSTPKRPLPPTLRSIFNPGPGDAASLGYGSAAAAAGRRNKPAFGLTFAQFLDLHLLCTRVPRTQRDMEMVLRGPGPGQNDRTARYAWVVEVLLDELGVGREEEKGEKEMEGGLPGRVFREQRWGAVDVRDGVQIVDAFEGSQEQRDVKFQGPVRLVAGFGGPRV
ncbi:hypothetical protein F5Y15DRAFT_370571 [Xylariaceae sp. FL0016]|nr:hypothetical protein F5Y15DRAFT_370571 [Xylariaceae sp. FL0016]